LPAPEATTIDRALEDGDQIGLGPYTLRVLHTPGHSPGSVSFSLASQSLCIVGDTLFAGGIGRTDILGGNFNTIIRSDPRAALHPA